MKNLKSKIAITCIENFQLKGIKRWRGREGNAINGKLYFQNELYCEYLDEAYGGESELRDVNKAVESKIKAFFKKVGFAQLMFDNGWNFMKLEEIRFDSMIDVVTEYVDEHMQVAASEKRFLNKMQKDMLTCILVGNQKTILEKGYRIWNFKRPLSSIPADILKKNIENIKTKLADGEEILNTNLPK